MDDVLTTGLGLIVITVVGSYIAFKFITMFLPMDGRERD